MSEEPILKKIENKICTLTFNREKVMNALNRQVLTMLKQYMDEIRFDPDVRVVVLTGAGSKAFSAGADLKERITLSESEVKQFIYDIRTNLNALANFPKPVIAAINGIALGGGTEISLACDIRIAAENAVMGLTETKLAIIPGGGGTQRLPRLIGYGKAKELIFTARTVDAREALEIGLVNKVTAPEDLLDETYKMAAMICNNGPIAVEQAKKAINRGCEVDLETGLAFESEAYQTTIPTKDRIEGLKAFKEKRKPEYKGE